MEYEQVLDRFRVTKRGRDTSMAICPCHDDRKASLSISRGNKGTVLNCHAGCKTEDIVAAAGLTMADLFSDQGKGATKARKPAWVTFLERDHGKLVDTYTYCDPFTGEYRYMRARFDPKSFGYFHWADPTTKDRALWGKGCKAYAIYTTDLRAIRQAASDGKEIFFVEGEKDVQAMAKRGFAATFTCGSADDWKQIGKQVAPLTKGAQLVILADFDQAGKKLAAQVARDCKPHAASIRALYPCKQLKGDVSDFFSQCGTQDLNEQAKQLRELVEQAGAYDPTGNPLEQPPQEEPVKEEKATPEPGGIADGEGSEEGGEMSESEKAEILRLTNLLREMGAEKLEHSDKGNGALYARIFKDKHAFDVTAKDWAAFDGVKWQADPNGLQAEKDAKRLAAALNAYAHTVDATGDGMLKQVRPLSNRPARVRMLEDAKSENFFKEEQMDVDPWTLNCLNGTLLLDGDKPQFVEHDAGMMLSMVCGASYDPEAKSELWEATVAEIMQGNEQKIRYLRQIAGLSLTGIMLKQAYFFHGESTNNGKSLFCTVLRELLGDYAQVLQPDALAVKQNPDSRTASPDIANIKGKRLITIAEPRRGMILDVQLFNQLCDGMDTIRARPLYKNELEFTPSAKMILHCNFLPKTLDDKSLFNSGRVHVLEFNRHFEESEQDHFLVDKLTTPSQLAGILNWALEGLADFRRNGMQEPSEVRAATAAYEQANDRLADFISERLVKKTGHNCKASEVYREYVEWAKSNGYGVMGKQSFNDSMRQRKLYADLANVGGRTWRGTILDHAIAEKQHSAEAGDFVDAVGSIPFD